MKKPTLMFLSIVLLMVIMYISRNYLIGVNWETAMIASGIITSVVGFPFVIISCCLMAVGNVLAVKEGGRFTVSWWYITIPASWVVITTGLLLKLTFM